MVEEALSEPDTSILLLSYTNRAVDEICAMLTDSGIATVPRSSVSATSCRATSVSCLTC